MRNTKRKKRERHNRTRVYLAALLMMLGLGIAVLFLGGNRAKARPEAVQKYYTSVTVQTGDTLWSIAQEYAPEYTDVRDYMDQLIRINELRNTDSLQPGQSLVIVYYQ